MPDQPSILEAALALGFVADELGSPTFRHPQCQISLVPMGFVPLVRLMGNSKFGRSMGYIEHDLPETLESLDQLKAYLAYYLRKAITLDPPPWLVEGRALSHLLPWERRRALYAARDHCSVRREWLRLALKDLTATLHELLVPEWVTLSFDGAVLTFESTRRIIVQAEGAAWRGGHAVEARNLTQLPKRLEGHTIEVSIWDGNLRIGNRVYRLATGPHRGVGDTDRVMRD